MKHYDDRTKKLFVLFDKGVRHGYMSDDDKRNKMMRKLSDDKNKHDIYLAGYDAGREKRRVVLCDIFLQDLTNRG